MEWLINKLLKWKGVPTEHKLLDDLDEFKIDQMCSEAQSLQRSSYFEWYTEDLELLAERKMFEGSKDLQLFGKGILYCIYMMKSNVAKMASGKVKSDSPEKKKMTRFIK